jgi:hypothetical protein
MLFCLVYPDSDFVLLPLIGILYFSNIGLLFLYWFLQMIFYI